MDVDDEFDDADAGGLAQQEGAAVRPQTNLTWDPGTNRYGLKNTFAAPELLRRLRRLFPNAPRDQHDHCPIEQLHALYQRGLVRKLEQQLMWEPKTGEYNECDTIDSMTKAVLADRLALLDPDWRPSWSKLSKDQLQESLRHFLLVSQRRRRELLSRPRLDGAAGGGGGGGGGCGGGSLHPLQIAHLQHLRRQEQRWAGKRR